MTLWAEYANNLIQLIISSNIIIQAERKDALLNSVKKVDFFLYLVKASHLPVWLLHFEFNSHLQKSKQNKSNMQKLSILNFPFKCILMLISRRIFKICHYSDFNIFCNNVPLIRRLFSNSSPISIITHVSRWWNCCILSRRIILRLIVLMFILTIVHSFKWKQNVSLSKLINVFWKLI